MYTNLSFFQHNEKRNAFYQNFGMVNKTLFQKNQINDTSIPHYDVETILNKLSHNLK